MQRSASRDFFILSMERDDMNDRQCTCPGGMQDLQCEVCSQRPAYWCDNCKKEVPEKRCPLCGLKTLKMK